MMTALENLAHRHDCPRCGAAAGQLCKDVVAVLHVERYDLARAAIAAEYGPQDTPRSHFHECVRCGQTVITRADPPICKTCRKAEREPQGEAMPLFSF
jgi:predicted RNA-binding Zn-ribbon protein involved in translation (DUF1610 family)